MNPLHIIDIAIDHLRELRLQAEWIRLARTLEPRPGRSSSARPAPAWRRGRLRPHGGQALAAPSSIIPSGLAPSILAPGAPASVSVQVPVAGLS